MSPRVMARVRRVRRYVSFYKITAIYLCIAVTAILVLLVENAEHTGNCRC